MWFDMDKIVLGMAAVRFLSSSIEFTAAVLMLKFASVEIAFKINALLALIGPSAMIIVTTLGLVGLAGKVSHSGMLSIFLGVILIFAGMHKL
ncbi:MAG TPA: YqhV family protein [Clostridia bacterium]|nr:YqhV family protein [Clostridia bacterium]